MVKPIAVVCAGIVVLNSVVPIPVVARTAPGQTRFAGGCVEVPEGYKVDLQKGPGFTVERILADVSAGGSDAMIGLYTGQFPDFSIPKGAKKHAARVGSQKITWYYWTEAEGDRLYHHYETTWIHPSERTTQDDDEPPLRYHLFVTGTDLTQVTALKRLVESVGDC